MKSVYLDWASTALIRPEIVPTISSALLSFQGNPSSVHSMGKKAREQIDISRQLCADLLGTKTDQLVFTSGGTESNTIILSSLFLRKPGGHIILSAIEHPSIYEYSEKLKKYGFDVDFIKPDKNGIIDPFKLGLFLKPNTIFVSIMSVNNETGAIQKIKEIVSIIRTYEQKNGRLIHLHTDAVQTLGKIPFNPILYNIDSASFSAHKIGGIKGIGMLYLKKPISVLSQGGGQENSIRPGTENTAGIISFSIAMEISYRDLEQNLNHTAKLRVLLHRELEKIHGIKLLFKNNNNENEKYSPYITSATVAPIPGEVLIRILSDKGYMLSTGSACSSRNRKKQIRVLTSSGVSEKDAAGSIRISIGWSTTESDILNFCSTLKGSISDLQKYRR
jgi:cysteine desulfurase